MQCRMVLVSSESSSLFDISIRDLSSFKRYAGIPDGFYCRASLDVRELGIQFGCVRLIPFVRKGLSL